MVSPTKNRKQDPHPSKKNVYSDCKPLCCCSFMKKNRRIMLPCAIKLKQPYFRPIFGHFCIKNPKTKILSKKFYPIFASHAVATSDKKFEKHNASICYKTQKTYFCPLFVQKLQYKIFSKKSFKSILSHFKINFKNL